MKIHGVDFYYAWCKSHGYIPIALKVLGSHMFGTNTPATKDIDFYGVHVQSPKDFMVLKEPTLVHTFNITANNTILEYKTMDILHFVKMIHRNSINEIIWLFKEPNLMVYDRIYNDLIYEWDLSFFLRNDLNKDFGNAFFGMMEGNYEKYIERKADKNHKLYKKFLHIFCNGWAYYKLLFKLAHTEEGYYGYLDIDFNLPPLIRNNVCILNLLDHKAQEKPLDDLELEYYKIKYNDFIEWLRAQEAKYIPQIEWNPKPNFDWLVPFRLGLFEKE